MCDSPADFPLFIHLQEKIGPSRQTRPMLTPLLGVGHLLPSVREYDDAAIIDFVGSLIMLKPNLSGLAHLLDSEGGARARIDCLACWRTGRRFIQHRRRCSWQSLFVGQRLLVSPTVSSVLPCPYKYDDTTSRSDTGVNTLASTSFRNRCGSASAVIHGFISHLLPYEREA